MTNTAQTTLQHAQATDIARSVQANIVRPARHPDDSLPDWRLFLFFRIRTSKEFQVTRDAITARLAAALRAGKGAAGSPEADQPFKDVWRSRTSRALAENPSDRTPAKGSGTSDNAQQLGADRFKTWIGALTGCDGEKWRGNLMGDLGLGSRSANSRGRKPAADAGDPIGSLFERFRTLREKMIDGSLSWSKRALPDQHLQLELFEVVGQIYSILASQHLPTLLDRFEGNDPAEAGTRVLGGGLPSVLIYDFLRQLAGAHSPDDGRPTSPGPLRSEADQHDLRVAGMLRDTPVNIGFTFSGLEKLGLDADTLSSFPDPFRQGMAARARILGDDGPSAPENWDGQLGLPSIHGFVSTTFRYRQNNDIVLGDPLEALDRDCAALTDRKTDWGRFLGFFIYAATNMLGIDIVQAELGQAAYRIDPETGDITRPPYRIEHFGFRDGISQPYIDLGLPRAHTGDGGSGGGTPAPDRSWDPVALGEFFLSEPDEDGNRHRQPANPDLRRGSTYMVFRKLEQDVARFRNFLANERPDSKADQTRLAAQFMGRWQNGTPLVNSPHAPLELGKDSTGLLNDFRYLESDPHGLKCPLGAHVRRSNPRDIGRMNNVRRHRILRRGIAYGGPLLDEDRLGDGRKRGILFIAMNARIDMQFELLQSNWLNSGEFLGQAGLDRCPIAGSNNGGTEDRFLEAGKGVPVTGLQRFVINRGGDYFFLPGLPALREMAANTVFAPDPCLPFEGKNMAATTPALLDPDRLAVIGKRILEGRDRVVRLEFEEPNSQPQRFVFAALHQDVTAILGLDQGHFSVEHYNRLARVLTAGGTMIVAEIPGEKRERLHKVLNRAWSIFNDDYCGGSASDRIRKTVRDRIDKAIRRAEKSGRIDLVRDLATEAAYGIVKDVYGLPGPDWVTELAIALPFGKRHVGEVPSDWLKAFTGNQPENPGLVTSQVWSVLLMLALLGNNQSFKELDALAVEAGSEMLIHLTSLIQKAAHERERQTDNGTLLGAFIQASAEFVKTHTGATGNADAIYDTLEEYLEDVRAILLEIVGTSVAAIPQTFSKVAGFVFEHDIRLSETLALAGAESEGESADTLISRFIYECERLDPNLPIMKRICTEEHRLQEVKIGDRVIAPAATIHKGDIVFLIVKAANVDPRVYRDTARTFSLKASDRPMDKYLLFGASHSGRDCWGRNRVSMVTLKELVQALTRFEGLRPVAGPAGEPEKLLAMNIGLKARFTGID